MNEDIEFVLKMIQTQCQCCKEVIPFSWWKKIIWKWVIKTQLKNGHSKEEVVNHIRSIMFKKHG